MRLYLDTNILVYLMMPRMRDNLTEDIKAVLFDYSNLMYTSSVCVQELLHIIQIGKFDGIFGRHGNFTAKDALSWLCESGIEICAPSFHCFEVLAELPFTVDHRDPTDRLIIAQAIADKATLVSSDRKFSNYRKFGLDFMFNER